MATQRIAVRTAQAVLSGLMVLATWATSAAGRPDLVFAALDRGTPHVAGELIVQFHDGFTPAEQARALGRIGARAVQTLLGGARRSDGRGDLVLARLPRGLGIADAVRGLQSESIVEFAEPNWIYQAHVTSNDTHYLNGRLWGTYSSDAPTPAGPGGTTNVFGSGAEQAWARTADCGNVWVGLIDEGYMYAHEDLAANAGTNPGEIAGNGQDDDGNGYVDDVRGWDFDRNDSTVFDGVSDDHGTHVAGTIGAVGGNGTGVAGICWSVRLMNAKFLGTRGGTTANAIRAVDYFTDLKSRHGLPLIATNNSWGGGGYSQALFDAIARAGAADILFIASAGNSAYDCDSASSCYPAEYTNANLVSVASIDSNGALSSFSNYGATTIDLGAPGRGIWSTVPVKSGRGPTATIVSGYASYSGTSMAAPHVTGAAAYYKARNPQADAAQIKAAILGGSTATSSLNGRTESKGRLNVSGF